MKLSSYLHASLVALAGVSSACNTSRECFTALSSVGITFKACVDASNKPCTSSNIATIAQQYSVQAGGTSYGYDVVGYIYAIRANAARAAQLMQTTLVTGSATCQGTRTPAGFFVFDNSCLKTSSGLTVVTTTVAPTTALPTTTTARPTTTSTVPSVGGACNGDLNTCLALLEERGFIAASQACKVNGAACALNQLPIQAARLAASLNAPAYAYTLAGQIYAIRINSNLVSSNLKAQAYYKVGSATCAGVALAPLYVFDTSCLAAQLSTTTTTTRTTLITTVSPTPTSGSIVQCDQQVALCSENVGLIQSINCNNVLTNLVCIIGGVVNTGQASLNLCLTNSCASYGTFGSNIFSSQSSVAEIKAAVAASVGVGRCTRPLTIKVSDRQCVN